MRHRLYRSSFQKKGLGLSITIGGVPRPGLTFLFILWAISPVVAQGNASKQLDRSIVSGAPKATASPSPSGPALMQILTDEIVSGLKQRRLDGSFEQFRNYAGYQLNLSTGERRVNEVTGNCRLSWYDYLLRNPLQAPMESEAFTRELFESLNRDRGGLHQAIAIAREKMDA